MNNKYVQLHNGLNGPFIFPRYVYHATVASCIAPLKERLLSRAYWRATDRDFGPAFYTTISFEQAASWASKAEEKQIGEIGCIVKIQCFPERYSGFNNVLAFLGDTNPLWTQFIVDHRYECDERGSDPCGPAHPAIVIGQMADNKMDIVKDEYDRNQTQIMDKYSFFYERMTRDKHGRRLDALQLGNQIAFCDEGMNELLSLISYFTYDENREEWVEHDA
ncbi:DUF3990 domain-containing protein [Paenibacillus athensensis]|uniref:DUF3990 domain-containing protein n=1 Tax=Paenibacillus athensensis TaxID=1967502 RepID=UPI00143185F6|nr:DUF3990 domain-containing protein [Paenibacillus athensensis]MCD1258399.1 DUF3990 domain-containing protein [Paenibacillus athensensis]